MMVEGGEIDWASHAHDAATAVKETLDFDQCVRLAYEFYKKHPNETLIMVTADHETGGLALGTVDVNLYAELLQYQKCSQETITAEMQEMKSRKKVPTWEEMKAYLKDKLGLWEHVPVTAREELELIVSYENSFLKKNAQNVVTLYAKDDPFAVDAVALLNKKACVGWTTKSHTGSPVPLYVVGKQADLYSGRRDNTDIPNILKREFKLSK
jgi:alkaline phosphatase